MDNYSVYTYSKEGEEDEQVFEVKFLDNMIEKINIFKNAKEMLEMNKNNIRIFNCVGKREYNKEDACEDDLEKKILNSKNLDEYYKINNTLTEVYILRPVNIKILNNLYLYFPWDDILISIVANEIIINAFIYVEGFVVLLYRNNVVQIVNITNINKKITDSNFSSIAFKKKHNLKLNSFYYELIYVIDNFDFDLVIKKENINSFMIENTEEITKLKQIIISEISLFYISSFQISRNLVVYVHYVEPNILYSLYSINQKKLILSFNNLIEFIDLSINNYHNKIKECLYMVLNTKKD